MSVLHLYTYEVWRAVQDLLWVVRRASFLH